LPGLIEASVWIMKNVEPVAIRSEQSPCRQTCRKPVSYATRPDGSLAAFAEEAADGLRLQEGGRSLRLIFGWHAGCSPSSPRTLVL
jgi:hypothetical protein